MKYLKIEHILLFLFFVIFASSCISDRRIAIKIEPQVYETTSENLDFPFQIDNYAKVEDYHSSTSIDLQNNKMGDMYSLYPQAHPDHPGYENPKDFADRINSHGLKWMRLSLDWFDANEIEAVDSYSTFEIDPKQEEAINALLEKGIDINYALVFWDEKITTGEGYSRFKDETEIERYLAYVRFIIEHFKGQIKYYSILNEPNIGKNTQQNVFPENYIELVRRVVPVIRENDPSAEIIIGEVTPLISRNSILYLNELLDSDVLSLVDGLSWHSTGWTTPEYMAEEYYEYKELIPDIIEKAKSNGFTGEFWATEMHWRTSESPHPEEFDGYSGISAAKYLAGSIVWHSGLGFNIGLAENLEHINKQPVIENLATILADVEPLDISSVEIKDFENLLFTGYKNPNGEYLLAIWLDVITEEDFPGQIAKITLSNIKANKIIGIDILNSQQQELLFSLENNTITLSNFIIRDYPIFLWIRSD